MGKAEIDAWAKGISPHSTGKKILKKRPRKYFCLSVRNKIVWLSQFPV